MKIVWEPITESDFTTLTNGNVRYAAMEVEGFSNDRVEVFMNLSVHGFTVVLIKGDPDDLDKTEYVTCQRETYVGALATAVQIAGSITPVREIMTAVKA